MKQLLSICLCLCLAAPFVGTYSWLRMEKHRVRKEIKRQMIAGVDKDELVFLKFTKAETETLHWHHSKEFEYLDQMYDIVETKVQGDSIFYWCWWDKEETSLNRQLEQLAEQANGMNPKNKQQQHKLIDFQKNLFHPTPVIGCALAKTLKSDPPLGNRQLAYSHLRSAPPSPPPEIV